MTEQNINQPIADDNSEKNDSTKAETNDQHGIPKARLDEVVAQRHKVTEERDNLLAKLDKIQSDQESARKKELEKQGEYKTLLEEQGKELDKYKADSTAWNDYKTNKRDSIMETITNDDDRDIAKDLSLAKLEKFANRVTQTNNVGTPNQSPANSTKGTGDYGGYSSWAEYAQKDPAGADRELHKNSKFK